MIEYLVQKDNYRSAMDQSANDKSLELIQEEIKEEEGYQKKGNVRSS